MHLMRNKEIRVTSRKKYWGRIKKIYWSPRTKHKCKVPQLRKKSHNLINTDTEVFMEAAVLEGISLWCVHHKCDIGGSSL